jgi:SAM-dependent methyltransferase
MDSSGVFNVNEIKRKFRLYGIDLVVLKNAIRGLSFYKNDFSELRKQRGEDKTFAFGKRFPILGERFTESGTMSGHYFHQDLLVARMIFENKPLKHVDIGSRTDGFVAHVAVFREIEIIDIRSQISKTNNIKFRRADLMQLPQNMINAYDSISTLHAIEHFGLGRYGDPIDYFGYLKALDNIYKILQTGGKFYFSVPIGPQRIEFNAHRIFSVKYLLDLFKTRYKVDSFSFVNDNGDLFENVELEASRIEANFGCNFGCGIFEMTKI